MPFNVTIFTLFPEAFPGTLGVSIHGKALSEGIWTLETVDLRPFGEGKHLKIDDTPAGGGVGMVLRADVLIKAFDAHIAADDPRPRFMMSPRGEVLNQGVVQKLANPLSPWERVPDRAGEGNLPDSPSSVATRHLLPKGEGKNGIILICGRYEGVDQRFLEARKIQELSIGDYVLSGGEVSALVVLESIIRLLPNVMGKVESGMDESHSHGLLEYPHYTRPLEVEGLKIPDVLLNGNHKHIDEWRKAQSEAHTQARRPDLWEKYLQAFHKN